LVDPHSPHSLHFFEHDDSPCADVITATPLIVDHVQNSVDEWGWDRDKLTVVFADAGAATRFTHVPHMLGADRAYIDKSRPDDSENPNIKAIVGDVKDRCCLIIDDEILTGTTAVKDAQIVQQHGAKAIAMATIHAPLEAPPDSPTAVENLLNSPIERFVITNTIPCEDKVAPYPDRFTVLSVAPLVAEAINRIVTGDSLTALHRMEMVDSYQH